MRKQTIIALAAVAMMASQASAADLPKKAPAYIPPAPPPYVWTGCYIGGNIGGATAHLDVTDVTTGFNGSRSATGFAGGGQIGCDYQFYNSWVVGIRNIFDGVDINNSRSFADPVFATPALGTINTKVNWFDALTGRLGYLVAPNWLIYGQGGAAWTKATVTAFNGLGAEVGSISGNSRTGWAAGGGVEWMFVPHWSTFIEYNYMGFGTRSSSFMVCGAGGVCPILSAKANIQNFLWGVNYKF